MTLTQPALVRSLDEPGLEVAEAGRKAARLAELRQAGFPVPPGLVLTVAAFEAGELSAGVLAALRFVADHFGAVALAVRSSGVAEDGDERSHAGQYETVLGVSGFDALVEAVRTCWRSADGARLREYRGGADRPGLAVLVQPLVPAVAAGVAFSADPVTGARDTVRVDAVPGLGDELVSGRVAPDEWAVGDAPVLVRGPHRVLSAEQAARVAELARRVAAEAGSPQDIEWAWTGEVVLLQARPITALPAAGPAPVPVEFEVPPGFWLRGGYTLKPLSPMNTSTLIRAVNRTSSNLFTYAFGERVEVLNLGGWSYVRIVPLASVAEVRARARKVVEAARADRPGEIVDRWYAEWLPGLRAAVAEVRAVALGALSGPELVAELDRRVELAHEAQRLHFLVGGVSSMVWGELGVVCRDRLGWDAAGILPMLTGLPGKAAEPARELARLARLAARDPGVLREPAGDFAEAFETYLVEYGQRCLGADLAEPSLAEQPRLVLSLISDQLDAGTDPAAASVAAVAEREETVAKARAKLSGADLARFDRALVRAQRAFPLRDDTGFEAHVAWAQVRYALRELAARLVSSGWLTAVDDVFLLTLDEARAAFTDGAAQHELVRLRAGQQAWSQAHLGPLTYGEHQAGPDREPVLAELSPADRGVLEPMLWIDSVSELGAGHRASAGDRLLRGTAASAGRYTGVVRVVISEREFAKLRPGDVLVCPETTPQWSVLFGGIGALVTDTGGLLSHPSILAREHGIPAVVATGNATEVLHDGQLVTVDGTTGAVEVLDAS
ncbi:PEP/pyruvate-binding domain-containing protein [Amycolatopsis sp. PS_44_ISF1]|uniref:PEP/pyruvate-binding domain-containing protein n=1 Tax=Amycolatopsis sp. PS_44_ISF1 TaxID=2974917 RepID=UPI0028E08250|nr:PEP/pyruvate-binding domain-containing protein [Amycolatopsis sp. PS_44_ISF1]MDT8910097.1 PEP-utilizing enzyme [Amycolatopsis sp. PS_44_ISF1]